MEEELHEAQGQLNEYSSAYQKLDAKVQHTNEMRNLLQDTVEAMSDHKAAVQSQDLTKRQPPEKKQLRVGNLLFISDEDYQGELESLREVIEAYKKRVFLLEKVVESLSQLKPGRESSLSVINEDGVPVQVLIRR